MWNPDFMSANIGALNFVLTTFRFLYLTVE